MQVFDSRNHYYKSYFGALPTDTPCRFRVALPRTVYANNPRLILFIPNQCEMSYPMEVEREDMEQVILRCEITVAQPGVYHYYFKMNADYNAICVKKQTNSSDAILTQYDGECYQLTVYEKGFSTPDFLKGGIFYQIFPDRFYPSGTPKGNVPDDRFLRSDWGGMPWFLPDENGEVKNNDYFGGDLEGIRQKLPYLKSLGVTCLYLNPIFEAHSNHRYNTADYRNVDPLLGTNEDFERLCADAKAEGISIILDGVFSHTGSDSIYFNRYGRYPNAGAYQDRYCRYNAWYKFYDFPNGYQSWWGFRTLPELNECNEDYRNFICGEDGVIPLWLSRGASGFRLDVADELPDSFIDTLRESIKRTRSDALILGEVWEDASNKESYGVKRRYLLGKQLDSVMNYPFKDAILSYLKDKNAHLFAERILTIVENYPKPVLDVLMNSLSTHDTARAITVLAGPDCAQHDRLWQSHHGLDKAAYQKGKTLLKLAMVLQYFLPGLPCIYYGDEAGMQGYKDPFNRGCYPWKQEDKELVRFAEELGRWRQASPAVRVGDFRFLAAEGGFTAILRQDGAHQTVAAINNTEREVILPLPHGFGKHRPFAGRVAAGNLIVPPFDCAVIST